MKILLTNDDGYTAQGIHILAKRLAKDHEVMIVAPENERSGASHAVSFFTGITYRKVECDDGIESYAVSGSPGDCVLFGVKYILKDIKPDLVISGINTVLNLGSDIMYSGTFGAAQEATYQGIKGVAVSLAAHKTDDYYFAADFVANNLNLFLKYASNEVTINVNIPYTTKEKIKGVKVVQTAFRPYEEKYEVHIAHDGSEVFFVNGHAISQMYTQNGGDCYYSENGYITISPIKLIGNMPELVKIMQAEDFCI